LAPPGLGQSLWFADQIEVRYRAPSLRPSDPPTFEVFRSGQLLRAGSWNSVLALVRKLLDPNLPQAEIRSTQARSSHSAASGGASDSPEWSRRHYG